MILVLLVLFLGHFRLFDTALQRLCTGSSDPVTHVQDAHLE